MSDSNTHREAAGAGALTWVLRGLGVLVGGIALVVLIAVLWIPSESGRRYIAKQIEEEASAGMGGSLEIGSLDEIKLFEGATGVRAKATDVRFLAPDGQETLHVVDADVTLGLVAILKKTVNIRKAIASEGTLTIEMGDNDKLTIENTFVDEGDDAPASENVGINLRHMNARKMRVKLKPDPEKSYNVVDIDGTVFVTRPTGGEFVTTELVDVHGTLKNPEFLGHTLTFSRLDGRIASDLDAHGRNIGAAEAGRGHDRHAPERRPRGGNSHQGARVGRR